MEIDRVHVSTVSIPLDRIVSGSNYTKESRSTAIVTVETNDGTVGRVYSGDERDEQDTLASYIVDELAPIIAGQDPMSIERMWEEMVQQSAEASSRGLYMHALGALDTAIWDLIGKATGQPLYKLWGGYRNSVPMIAIGGYYTDEGGPETLGEEIREYEKMGLSGMKMKVGGRSPSEDLERLRQARNAAGSDFVIACDANQGWTLDEALTFAEQAGQHDIEWFEEPVAWYDQYEGMNTVREECGIVVTAGQSEIAPSGCKRLLESNAVDIINYDASLGGGPTAWLKVAAVAEANDVAMGHHEEPQIAMHLLSAIPNGGFVECFHPDLDPVWYELVTNTPSVEDGRLRLPDEPGLGIELNDEMIEEYTVETYEYSA